MREYILQMELHVTELHKNSVRFIKRLSEMSSSLAEFGASMENLGKFEPDSVAANFKRIAEKTEILAQQGQVRSNLIFCSSVRFVTMLAVYQGPHSGKNERQ